MPELATLAAFLLLAALLVYVILQVPVTGRSDEENVDLREPARTAAERSGNTTFRARLVLVRPGLRTVTIDGMTSATGDLFAIEVGRPEGWAREDADAQLKAWARDDTVVEVQLRDDVRGHRVWVSSGDTAMDLPIAGRLGAPL